MLQGLDMRELTRIVYFPYPEIKIGKRTTSINKNTMNNLSPLARGAAIKKIKKWMAKGIQQGLKDKSFRHIKYGEFPIHVHMNVYKSVDKSYFDLPNLRVFFDYFFDTLTDKELTNSKVSIIPDDNFLYVVSDSSSLIPVSSAMDSKLEFILYKVESEIYQNNPIWNNNFLKTGKM
jgi:hypothetical protein